ncbi:MAG TPA: glycoside hydrolase family 3 C-terminal domain-containing protein, partial [Terriglobales bacterium]
QKVNQIVSQMTLEEKIDYIGGLNEFYIRAVPRLGVPELKMADGPAGVRNYGHSTAYPTGIALAASWDTALVQKVGEMMGKDSRARGVHFLLAPGVNIYRAPMCGRNFEYFGEDPFLASRTAIADIKGIQSQYVIATVKHYAANNQEWDRHHVSSDVDERTLREIYLPTFEGAVRDAHVGAIMDSYNLVNGVHSTQSDWLNTQVLRKDWGFDGIVMSDWNATYDAVGAANGGLDLEMPNGKFMNRQNLLAAIQAGKISPATIDEKVRRILSTAMRFGFFERPQTDSSIPLDNPEARKVALEAARDSIVLLKNDNILPLSASKVKTIAVVGPMAEPASYGGGGSGLVQPFSTVSILSGVQTLVGNKVNVTYGPGVPLARVDFKKTSFTTSADGNTPGLKAEYFNNRDLVGTPSLTRTDEHVAFDFENSYAAGQPKENFSARWTGYYTPTKSGPFVFSVSGDDGYRLWVDDQPFIDRWIEQGDTLTQQTKELVAGRHYKIRLEYFQAGGDATIGLGITDENNIELGRARDLAAKADAVILCIGFDAMSEGEGSDRTFEISPNQLKLVDAVLAANKNVIVVITAGGNIDMSRFVDKVPGVLHAWYPGQEGGTAVAEVLFGKVNPSGKLPISLERRWEDNATYNSYYDKTGTKRVAYTEGVFLGYRHFDRSTVKPLFPFGYGLSYTTFRYSGLKVSKPAADGTVTVSFTIANTGKREGAEVAEVYVSDKHAPVPRPVKELKGFTKLHLEPGESRTAQVTLDRRAFAYYDVGAHSWTVAPGQFEILVGPSSAKIELQKNIDIH